MLGPTAAEATLSPVHLRSAFVERVLTMTNGLRLDKPIILLGFHRSGTSILGRVFSQHPTVAYWPEPRHVWMHYFPYRRYDVLAASDAKPRVVDRIHGEFLEFLSEQVRSQFVEKTPSNMVRLPFIQQVMPDARIVHIIRDGRACTYSTLEVLRRPYTGAQVGRRMKQVPWWHYPAYLPKFWRNAVLPRMSGKPVPYWGPRVPGLRERVADMPLDEVCAWQWQATMNTARGDAQGMAPDQYREWRYEDLVTAPERTVREMFEFTGLEYRTEMDQWLGDNVNVASLDKWRANMSGDAVRRIGSHLEPLLSDLGYT